ncbi:YadA-like family protein [Ectopseudomonas khazarica]|uniref:YadA-like family protein n=1 Tax=Ectopseudomonas khazarica TaxID=2502979 RepID=UPI0037C83725
MLQIDREFLSIRELMSPIDCLVRDIFRGPVRVVSVWRTRYGTSRSVVVRRGLLAVGLIGGVASLSSVEAYEVAGGTDCVVAADDRIAIGDGASACENAAIAIGSAATVTGMDGIAIGSQSQASDINAINIGGNFSLSSGANSIGIGMQGQAAAGNAIYLGTNAQAMALNAMALGGVSQALGESSVALGAYANAVGSYSLALGGGAQAQSSGMIVIGSLAGSGAMGERNLMVGQSAGQQIQGIDNAFVGFDAGSYSEGQSNTGMGHFTSNNVQGDYNSAFGAWAGHNVTGTANTAIGLDAGIDLTGSYNFAGGADAGRDSSGSANVATGYQAGRTVNGDNNVAIGLSAGSSVIGAANIALGVRAGSTIETSNSVSIGYQARASATDAIAIGSNAQASGIQAISIGFGNRVSGNKSGAIGDPTTVSGTGSYSLGNDNSISADDAGVFGNGSTLRATATGSRIIGNGNDLDVADAFVIGNVADVTVAGGVALGNGSIADTGMGMAGYNPASNAIDRLDARIVATESTTGALAVGDAGSAVFRQITGVAAGTEDSDAVNVAQLRSVSTAAYAGWGLSTGGGGAINLAPGGEVNLRNADGNLVIGQATRNGREEVTFDLSDDLAVTSLSAGNALLNGNGLTIVGGPSLTVSGIDAAGTRILNVAAGVNGGDAVNLFQLNETNEQVTLIDGRVSTLEGSLATLNNGGGIKYFRASSNKADAVASGTDSVAVGPDARASGSSAVAMGNEAEASGQGATAVGSAAQATGDSSVAIGANASASQANSVALGADSVADRGAQANYAAFALSGTQTSVGEVGVGTAAGNRQITGVAAGSGDSDAVNVAQLKGVDQKIAAVSGDVSQVTNEVKVVDARVTQVERGDAGMFRVNQGNAPVAPQAGGLDSVAGGSGAVASAGSSVAIGTRASATRENSVALGANAVADRDNSVSVGSAGAERQITNVAAGTQDTDAVNLAQLNSSVNGITSNANSYTDQRFAELKNDLHEQDDILSAGIAGAMAMASLPQPYAPGASMTAAGLSSYRGQSALAIGVSRISDSGRWVTKLQGNTNSQGDLGLSVGIGYQW